MSRGDPLPPPRLVHDQRLQPDDRGADPRRISVLGSRILAVRGRKTGLWRTTPVNLLTMRGRGTWWPPGVTQWVRNVRAGCDVELRVGRRREPVALTELADDEKLTVLREYLRRWKVEIGAFFQGWARTPRMPTWRGSRPATRPSVSTRAGWLIAETRRSGETPSQAASPTWLPARSCQPATAAAEAIGRSASQIHTETRLAAMTRPSTQTPVHPRPA